MVYKIDFKTVPARLIAVSPFKVICAWCNIEKDNSNHDSNKVSHGICDDCSSKTKFKYKYKLA